ncbi:prolyl 3-hydroxylase 2-like isoform X1 [Sycon ciliatum]|uniref:prolyl 3-hydroxylase 2-like isoform X1 n=1 Tax=Sycon ciliatum TaxID=27933 RepID=UPI0031F6D215
MATTGHYTLVLLAVVVCAATAAVPKAAKLTDTRYEVKSTYDELYEDGKLAYSKQEWTKVVEVLEKALTDYKAERSGMALCYGECKTDKSTPLLGDTSSEQEVIRHLAAQAVCVEACKRRRMGLRGPVSKTVREQFNAAYPFHYLQYAYFQLGNITKAAEAAFTYAMFNPDDEDMSANLETYKEMPEMKDFALRPGQEPTARVLYNLAAKSYLKEEYAKTITTMTVAIAEFFNEYHVCRSQCDTVAGFRSEDDDESNDDDKHSFLAVLVQMHRKQLTCRLQCWIDLGKGYDKYHPLDVLPETLNYIQFSQSKVENNEGAMQAAVDYLTLKPHDAVMKGNIKYYESVGMKRKDFEPSENVLMAALEVRNDRKLLKRLRGGSRKTEEQAFREELGIDDVVEDDDVENIFKDFSHVQRTKKHQSDSETSSSSPLPSTTTTGSEKAKRAKHGETGYYTNTKAQVVSSKEEIRARSAISPVAADDEIFEEDASNAADSTSVPIPESVRVVESPADHQGLARVLIDGLATEDQCKTLLELSKEAKPGSGYGGRSSPHTDKEFFEGLTVSEAAQGAESGAFNLSSVLLYLDLAENSRKYLESYFKLDNLYFSYSHLVCRTSLVKPEDIKDELALSHPVHADNCILKEDGRCVKESPAYTWRDYSAILYLNDDFVGGDFFYAHRGNRTVQHTVRPACGRLVGFGADESNLHGVLPLLSGRRCVVALWMTLEANKDEGDHDATIARLEKLRRAKVAAARREEL